MIAVRKGSKWGFIDLHNQVRIPFLFDHVTGFQRRSFSEDYKTPHSHTNSGWSAVQSGHSWGILAPSGDYIVRNMPVSPGFIDDCNVARGECKISGWGLPAAVISTNTHWIQCGEDKKWTVGSCPQ